MEKGEAKRGFGSDNCSGVDARILEAIARANAGHCVSYGDDPHSERARQMIAELFGGGEVHFVMNGTGANVLSLAQATRPYNSVICAQTAHINVDECGAPERVAGVKLVTVEGRDGKITPEDVLPHLHVFGFEHHSQPGAISISQSTELGTVYRPDEIRALADLAHSHGMWLHMDGARLANAAASLGLPARAMTRDAGVDIVSFGGTKNGMLLGESVVILAPELAPGFKYLRKQATQLYSKQRFVGAQFEAYLSDGLWLDNARHANAMARKLARAAGQIPGVRVTRPVEANGVFAVIPPEWVEPLLAEYFFYTWDDATGEVRWLCSFDTTDGDVEAFAAALARLAARG